MNERRIGRFEQAQGGTLFLDEIGEIDAMVQVKLLRFLGERTFERVGSSKTLLADVRVVAATNKDLAKSVKEGSFREDLYFRLRVVPVWMPALRERPGDIPLLARSFLRQFSREHGRPLREFSPDAVRAMMGYRWPGNVRELRSDVERAVVLAQGERIELDDLSRNIREEFEGGVPSRAIMHLNDNGLTVKAAEKQLIIKALEGAKGNRTLAAKKIGISRRTLHRKLHAYNLEGN